LLQINLDSTPDSSTGPAFPHQLKHCAIPIYGMTMRPKLFNTLSHTSPQALNDKVLASMSTTGLQIHRAANDWLKAPKTI